MALPLKSGADLYNQQAIRMRLHNLGADPLSDFGAGQIYFNTSTDSDTAKRVRLYDGTSFRSLAYYDEIADNEEFNALEGRVGTLETMLNTQDAEGVINTWNEIQTFLDSVQEGTDLMDLLNSKLDKSGGTLTGSTGNLLVINRTSGNPIITFQSNGTVVGRLGINVNGYPIFGTAEGGAHALLHAGNIGDYNFAKSINGVLESYPDIDATAWGLYGGKLGGAAGTFPTSGCAYGAFLSFGWNGYDVQISSRSHTTYLRTRENGTFSDWKTIAFTDSNVASATKLEDNSAFSIFGNTFFENGKPKTIGFFTNATLQGVSFITNDGEGTAGYISRASGNNDDIYLLSKTNLRFYAGSTQSMFINSSGNVLIGASADDNSGAKLQVAGTIKTTGGVRFRWGDYFDEAGNFVINNGTAWSVSDGVSPILTITKNTRKTTISGDLHVTGNIVATGEVSAGGAGAEGSGSGGGASVHQEVFTPTSTTVGINHNLGTEDIIITLYEWDSTISRWSMCLTDIEIADANNIDITFGSTSSVQHKVVIMAASA